MRKQVFGLKQLIVQGSSVLFLQQQPNQAGFIVGFLNTGKNAGIAHVSCRLQKSVNAVGFAPDSFSSGHLFILSD